MRFPEADGQKERLLFLVDFLQCFDGEVGDATIKVSRIRYVATFGSRRFRQVDRQLPVIV